MINRAWNLSASFRLTQWLNKILHKIILPLLLHIKWASNLQSPIPCPVKSLLWSWRCSPFNYLLSSLSRFLIGIVFNIIHFFSKKRKLLKNAQENPAQNWISLKNFLEKNLSKILPLGKKKKHVTSDPHVCIFSFLFICYETMSKLQPELLYRLKFWWAVF